MKRRVVLAAALPLLLSAAPALADTAAEPCASSAHVSWRTDDTWTRIDGAVVTAPGCDAGEAVGLQVLTNDGSIPAEPLVSAMEDDRATFDLTAHDIQIAPVVGVRVSLSGQSVPVDGDEPSEGAGGSGVGGVSTERPEGARDTRPQPIVQPGPPAEHGGSQALSTTGSSVAVLLVTGIVTLLGGSALRRRGRRQPT